MALVAKIMQISRIWLITGRDTAFRTDTWQEIEINWADKTKRLVFARISRDPVMPKSTAWYGVLVQRQVPRITLLRPQAKHLGVSLEWLKTGKGNMLSGLGKQQESQPLPNALVRDDICLNLPEIGQRLQSWLDTDPPLAPPVREMLQEQAQYWTTRKRKVKIWEVGQIARKAHVSWGWLLTGIGEPPRASTLKDLDRYEGPDWLRRIVFLLLKEHASKSRLGLYRNYADTASLPFHVKAHLRKFAHLRRVSLSWLMTGKGPRPQLVAPLPSAPLPPSSILPASASSEPQTTVAVEKESPSPEQSVLSETRQEPPVAMERSLTDEDKTESASTPKFCERLCREAQVWLEKFYLSNPRKAEPTEAKHVPDYPSQARNETESKEMNKSKVSSQQSADPIPEVNATETPDLPEESQQPLPEQWLDEFKTAGPSSFAKQIADSVLQRSWNREFPVDIIGMFACHFIRVEVKNCPWR